MTPEFTAAMARATAATNARNLTEATRIIAEALSPRRAERTEAEPSPAPRAAEPEHPETEAAARDVIEAEIVAPESIAPDAGASSAPATPPRGASGPLGGLSRRVRRPLREALRLLREGRLALGLTRDGALRAPLAEPLAMPFANPPVGPLVEPGAAERPEGARFEERWFECAAGGRGYKLYVPAARPARGLVVMLHGCKQNPDDFAAGTGMNAVAEENGLAVVYPRQGSGDNLSGCWNWFRPGDQRRDAGEPAIIAGITRAAMDELGLEPGLIFVAGLSAGGAMAAVMAEAYPELYAAAGVHSGVATGAANDVLSAFAAMRGDPGPRAGAAEGQGRTRTIVFHGDADRTVHPANAARLIAVPPGATREAGRSAGGRSYSRTVVPGGAAGPGGEVWLIEAAGHAWSGGRASGSYTDPAGPDASAEMARFFLEGVDGGAAEESPPAPPA